MTEFGMEIDRVLLERANNNLSEGIVDAVKNFIDRDDLIESSTGEVNKKVGVVFLNDWMGDKNAFVQGLYGAGLSLTSLPLSGVSDIGNSLRSDQAAGSSIKSALRGTGKLILTVSAIKQSKDFIMSLKGGRQKYSMFERAVNKVKELYKKYKRGEVSKTRFVLVLAILALISISIIFAVWDISVGIFDSIKDLINEDLGKSRAFMLSSISVMLGLIATGLYRAGGDLSKLANDIELRNALIKIARKLKR